MYPPVLKVIPKENYHIEIYYENGEVKLFDVNPYIQGDWYGQLKDYPYFCSVHPHPITKDTIQWAGGQDIAAHELYEHSKLV